MILRSLIFAGTSSFLIFLAGWAGTPWSVPRFRLRQAYGAAGSEAVVSKAR